MAEIRIRVCDRCGKELKDSWLLIQRPKKPKRIKLFRTSHDPYGYWETEYELCNDCSAKLTEFLRRQKDIET